MKMLKIEVNKVKKEKKPELPKYPYFGELKDDCGKVVVLFTGVEKGMVVESTNSDHKMYEIRLNWAESNFKKIDNYSITISTIN